MKKIIILLILLITTNCYADLFADKPSNIRRWLAAKGYNGSTYDALNAYFGSLSTLSRGTLEDNINDVLSNQGYSGTLDDKLNAFFTTKTGQGNRRDAERAFWSNDSLSFAAGGGGGGNFILLVDGSSKILLVDGSSKLLLIN